MMYKIASDGSGRLSRAATVLIFAMYKTEPITTREIIDAAKPTFRKDIRNNTKNFLIYLVGEDYMEKVDGIYLEGSFIITRKGIDAVFTGLSKEELDYLGLVPENYQ